MGAIEIKEINLLKDLLDGNILKLTSQMDDMATYSKSKSFVKEPFRPCKVYPSPLQ